MRRVLDGVAPATVLCLQAPGGYGKTTALAQWAAHDPRPVVWLRVRRVAADPYRLTRSLVGALKDAGLTHDADPWPGRGDPASWHLDTLPVVEALVSSAEEPFVAVIDGVEDMSGSPWEWLVESLASSLPRGSTLAMGTRDALPATLWRLHAGGEVRVVGPEVLAFDELEAAQLMALLGVRWPRDRLERLLRRTEGWPVAVYLTGLAALNGHQGVRPAADGAGLDEYLRTEIVGRLPPDDARFLRRASVLASLDAPACDALTGAPDSSARLHRLSAVNHLLAPQGESHDGQRFRMQPLLARFLEDDLRERDPVAWRTAHSTACRVEERRGDIDRAVHHARLSGDDARLSELVWSHAVEPLGHGRWDVVARWLEGVDPGRLHSRRGLALSAAWAAIQAGDVPRANRAAVAAAAAADGEALRPYLDLLRAAIGGEGLEHIEAATRKFVTTMPTDDRWKTLAYYLLGVALVLRDRPDEGVEAFEAGRRRAEALDVPVVRALCLAGLADAALLWGEQHRALSYVRTARAVASSCRLDAVAASAPVFATSAVAYLAEGRHGDARREASRALRHIALMGDTAPWHAVVGRLALARVNLGLGDPERARVLLEEAGDARGPATASPVIDRMYAETQEHLSRLTTHLTGASSLTTAEVRVLQYLPTHLSFPQIAAELVVSRHTVKTQAMSAYRKLGVHTRTQAIERARHAGLLPPG